MTDIVVFDEDQTHVEESRQRGETPMMDLQDLIQNMGGTKKICEQWPEFILHHTAFVNGGPLHALAHYRRSWLFMELTVRKARAELALMEKERQTCLRELQRAHTRFYGAE